MNTLIILAAGKGTRLQPLTDDTPKCLLDVAGRPILNRLLDQFQPWVDQVVIVTGYLNERIEAHLENLSLEATVKTEYNPHYAKTNSLYSAALTKEAWVQSSDIVFTNSDVVFKNGALDRFLKTDHSMGLLVDLKECDREDMRVNIDKTDDKIIRVSKEIPLEESHGEFTGVAKINRQSLSLFTHVVEELLKKDNMVKNGWYDLVFDHIARNNETLDYIKVPSDSYYEIDTLKDYKKAELAISRQ